MKAGKKKSTGIQGGTPVPAARSLWPSQRLAEASAHTECICIASVQCMYINVAEYVLVKVLHRLSPSITAFGCIVLSWGVLSTWVAVDLTQFSFSNHVHVQMHTHTHTHTPVGW